MKPFKLHILGVRGIPAAHGGFETFAEKLAVYLQSEGWDVTVYCQTSSDSGTDIWNGINRVKIAVKGNGSLSSMLFDFLSILHASSESGIHLTLGYNTAVFNLFQRIKGNVNLINMDGIEWKRKKWGSLAKFWFWMNERFGCHVGNHLIADHPEILSHLSTRVSASKISMIPYGADLVDNADLSIIEQFGLAPASYAIVIARPEPENSILEIVRAFASKERQRKLVLLGSFDFENNAYHREVKQAANQNVLFAGAIYDKQIVNALRYFARLYVHGHQVGGTNPSLVEALGAGNAVIAHDNRYNRWVAGDGARYFADEAQCIQLLDELLDDDGAIQTLSTNSRQRFAKQFTWHNVLDEYKQLLLRWYPQH